MNPEESLIACRAIHIELERLTQRTLELARFRCAEPSNQAFLNVMERQTELLAALDELHNRLARELRSPSRAPLGRVDSCP